MKDFYMGINSYALPELYNFLNGRYFMYSYIYNNPISDCINLLRADIIKEG